MRKLRNLLACLFLLCPSLGLAQGFHFQYTVRTKSGLVVPNPTVRVCTEPAVGLTCSPLATIYSDVALTLPIVQPFSGGSDGTVSFYTPAAMQVHVQFTSPFITQTDLPYVQLGLSIGVQSVTGTANEINVSSSSGNVTLSTPQPIATTSSPTFSSVGAQNTFLIPGTGVIQFTSNGSLLGPVDLGLSHCFSQVLCVGTGANGDANAQVLAASMTTSSLGINVSNGRLGWLNDTTITKDSNNVFDFGNGGPQDKSATLQAATTIMGTSDIVDDGTHNTIQKPNQVLVGSTGVYGFSSTAKANGSSAIAGISEDGAGIVDIGNGTAGDKSGTLKAANATLSSTVSTVTASVSGTTTTANLTTTGTTTLPFTGGGNQCLQVNNIGQVSATGSGCGSSTGSGVTSVAGTAHQIIASSSTGNITLSTPQSIDTTSDVTFHTVAEPLIAAPGTPSGGIWWEDSTDFRFHDKNGAGSVGTTVAPGTLAAHNFATNISNSGVLGGAQPLFSDIGSTASLGQLPGGGVTTINGTGFTLGTSGNLGRLNDGNGNAVLTNNAAIGAVDFFTMQNSATGNPAIISIAASGADGNISMNMIPKGTGTFQVLGQQVFINPMNTLGDTIFENATPAAARLAGNTSATKEYLSQTGTGTISASPAWSQVNFTDIAGVATKSQLPPTTVYTDQNNTFGAATTQDFHQVAHMTPYPVGTFANRPSNCAVGEAYFATDVQYGRNIYGCVSPGLWILQSGGLSPTVARVDFVSQTASIPTATFFFPSQAGFYILSGTVLTHTNPTGGGTPSIFASVISNDGTNSFRVGNNYDGTAAPWGYQFSSGLVWIAANQGVTYSVTVTGTGANYDLHLVAERVDPNIGNVAFTQTFTGLTTAKSPTVAFVPNAAGFYRVGMYAIVHGAPLSGSLSPKSTFNDGFFSNTADSFILSTGVDPSGHDCNSSLGCFSSSNPITATGSYSLDSGNTWIGAGQPISFEFDFNSVTGTPNYDLYVVVELVSANTSNTNVISILDKTGLTTASAGTGCIAINNAGMYRMSADVILRNGFSSGVITQNLGAGFFSTAMPVGPTAGGYWWGMHTWTFGVQGNTNQGTGPGWNNAQGCLLGITNFNSIVGSPLYDFHVLAERLD